MVGSNCQAGWGKMVQCWLWARCGFYRRGSLRNARESLVMVAQASSQRDKEVRPEDKMAADSQSGDLITLSLVNMVSERKWRSWKDRHTEKESATFISSRSLLGRGDLRGTLHHQSNTLRVARACLSYRLGILTILWWEKRLEGDGH
jgi:hypothetical protein